MKNRIFMITLALTIMSGTALGAPKITGDLVEPAVMLVFDTSGSMDWLADPPSEDQSHWDLAQEACEANDASRKTSWQQVLDAFLGGINSNYRCSVEPAKLRPVLDGLSADKRAEIRDFLPEYLSEFRESFYPHFRAMECPGGQWFLNDAGFYQCINDDPSSVDLIAAADMTVQTPPPPGTVRCGKEDYELINGVKVCWDMHPEVAKRGNNGILDRFFSSARFGVMTYDNVPRLLATGATQHDLGWDYGDLRDWDCPQVFEGDCLDWNAGARADQLGAIGGLVRISSSLEEANNAVRNVLNTMEPLNCSPMGALLDDIGYYFATDPQVLPKNHVPAKRDPILVERLGATYVGQDPYYRCRPKLAIFISDGQPTPDFEFPAGSCLDVSENQDVFKPTSTAPGADYMFRCPWRSSLMEAKELFELSSEIDNQATPILLVVVGFNVPPDDPAAPGYIDCSETTQPVPDQCVELTESYVPCRSVYNNKHYLNPREFLNEMACQGWQPSAPTQPPWIQSDGDPTVYNCNGGDIDGKGCALFVTSEDLLAKIAMVVETFTSQVVTRTDVVTWNIPYDPAAPAVQQYDFNSGYIAKYTDRTLPTSQWDGVLWRNAVSCNQNIASYESVDVGAIVNDQTIREIFALPRPDGGDNNTYATLLLAAEDYPNPQANLLEWITLANPNTPNVAKPDFQLKPINATGTNYFTDCDFGVAADLPAGYENLCYNPTASPVRDQAVAFTLARGLADIYNSTPAVLGPPREQLPHVSYKLYKGNVDNYNRKPFLFVGTNDGVLHALDVESMTAASTSVEAWGYIPRPLLSQVKNQYPISDIVMDTGYTGYTLPSNTTELYYQHQWGLDGSPVARDVLLFRNLEALSPAEDEQKWWRAVVFGGMGMGARAYYALDVTEFLQTSDQSTPAAPRLRWEISPYDNLWGNNEPPVPPPPHPFQKLGHTISKPGLAYVRYQADDFGAQPVLIQVAAAILPGGQDPDPYVNTGVYVVRLADGKLIRYLDPKVSTDICSYSAGLTEPENAQLVGEPIVPYGSRLLKIAERAYIGDDRGRLWMIDMTDPNEANWCLSLYFDTLLAFQYPEDDCSYPTFVNKPTIAQAQTGSARNDVIIFGTGQYDQLSDLTCNRIVSLTDTIAVDAYGKPYHKPQVNWWIGTALPNNPTPLAGIDDWRRVEIWNMMDTDTWVNFDTPPDPDTDLFFNIGEKQIGTPVVFDDVVYFVTFIPMDSPTLDDPCNQGRSRIWAVDFNNRNGQDLVTGADDTDWETIYSQNDFGCFLEGTDRAMFKEYPGELLTGVNVVRRPCGQTADEGLFKLVAQKPNPGFDLATASPGDNPLSKVENTLSKRSGKPKTIVRFDSWSIVF